MGGFWLFPQSYALNVTYTFDTAIDTPDELRLIAAISINIRASYEDSNYEGCFILIFNIIDRQWESTGQTIISGFRWSNLTLSLPSRYIDNTGQVKITIGDGMRGGGGLWGSATDDKQGILKIDYIEVRGEPVALKITNLGGLDVALSRLWINNDTETSAPEQDHIYTNLESLDPPVWILPGSQQVIVLSDRTVFYKGSLEVAWDEGKIKVQYVPPAGQTVIFKIITKDGNTAACSYSFPSD
jgi:hypothetical protein